MANYVFTNNHFIKLQSIQCIWPSANGHWRVFLEGGNYFDVDSLAANELIEDVVRAIKGELA